MSAGEVAGLLERVPGPPVWRAQTQRPLGVAKAGEGRQQGPSARHAATITPVWPEGLPRGAGSAPQREDGLLLTAARPGTQHQVRRGQEAATPTVARAPTREPPAVGRVAPPPGGCPSRTAGVEALGQELPEEYCKERIRHNDSCPAGCVPSPSQKSSLRQRGITYGIWKRSRAT